MTHANTSPGEMDTHTAPPPGVCGVFAHFWRTLLTLIAILACPSRRAEGESRLDALEREIARELLRRALIQMGRDPALADQLDPRFVLRGDACDIDFGAPGTPAPARIGLREYARRLRIYKRWVAAVYAFTRRGRSPRRVTRRLHILNRRRLQSRRTRAFLARRRAAPWRADLDLMPGRAPP